MANKEFLLDCMQPGTFWAFKGKKNSTTTRGIRVLLVDLDHDIEASHILKPTGHAYMLFGAR